MEFIQNRVNIKELAAVCIAAFFAGHINLFHGTFPVAAAFVTIMLMVSTVYIYLLPVVLGGMAWYIGEGAFVYGDMAATICLALFFLFFHRRKFSLNQRTVIGGAALVLCNLAAYGWTDMLFAFRLETIVMEILAYYIYVRVWYTLARVLYGGEELSVYSREYVSLSLEVLVVSFAGAIGSYQVTFAIWLFFIAYVLYYKGLKEAFVFVCLPLCRDYGILVSGRMD